MFCPHCGTPNADNNYKCVKCAKVIQPVRVETVQESIGNSAAVRMMLPIGRSGLAIAAGYFGLFALLVVPAPIALILGLLAIRDIKAHPHKLGMGRAIFGAAIGAIGTAILAWVAFELSTDALNRR
jgi:hypothetical protein